MNASVRSGNWKVFADRYDVDVNDIPVELKRKANNIIIKAYDAMRRAFKTVLDIMNGNKPVTDAQVRAYVDSLGTLNQRDVFNVDPEIMSDIARSKGYNSVDEMYKAEGINRLDKNAQYNLLLNELGASEFTGDTEVSPE